MPDVEESPLLAGTESLGVLRRAGVRAVVSTPVTSHDGELLGMLTVQWGSSYNPPQEDLSRLDVLVRLASDLIERKKVETEFSYLATFPQLNPNPITEVDPDGGHLLFFAIEGVIGRPVSVRMREVAQQIGLFLLISLMVFVFYNDIMRLLGFRP